MHPSQRPDAPTMTKKEVAEFLNVSLRTVDNYVDRGRLLVSKVKGKTNLVAVCDRAEVERLKVALEEEQKPQRRGPIIDSETQALASSRANRKITQPRQDFAIATIDPAILESFANAANTMQDSFRQIAQMMQESFCSALQNLKHPVIALNDKLCLNKTEAIQVSGLGEYRITQALESGKLPHEKNGRYYILRADLDEYIEQLRKAAKEAIAQSKGA